jgi:hypothetical protein
MVSQRSADLRKTFRLGTSQWELFGPFQSLLSIHRYATSDSDIESRGEVNQLFDECQIVSDVADRATMVVAE